MAQVLERVAALPADAVVHFSIFSVDGEGQRFIPRDALARIAAQSRAPVFGDLDSYLGTGAVGGRMTDIRSFGAAVAARVAPILRGSDAGAVEPGESSWSTPVVDWRALRRWDVDERRLPPGTEVRFRPPSLWEEHRSAVLGVAAAFAVLLLLIGRLLHERRQRLVAEAEARARMTELARANRISAAGELAAAIAHDLGQPLAAIRSNVESIELLLEAHPPRVPEARSALADVLRDDQRAADVIERLRSLFRKSGPQQGEVRIDRLFEDVIGMASGAARKRRVVIESELDAPPIAVRADVIELQQVFINLLLNALEAIPEGAARRKVVMSARRIAGGGIRLGIADSGTGVPEPERGRILEPFYTTKPDGTGVGLAIVRRIVESHGAKLEVSGSGLGGADFSFVLPEERAAA
jgi:signal transduction histidine kinase